jgi:hypothetical protein
VGSRFRQHCLLVRQLNLGWLDHSGHAAAPLFVKEAGMITTALLLGLIGVLALILIGMTILAACLWNAQGDDASYDP